jgi:hypothetical protein
MGFLELQGNDWKRITGILENSFRLSELERLIGPQFPRIDREIAWGRGLADVVFEITDTANRHGQLDQLLVAATQERQFRPDLRSLVLYFSQRPGWTASFESNGLDVGGALERLTITGDPFVDTTFLAKWIIRVERQVCQVRCGKEHGTGFLVAPDLVMTCYHVVMDHLKGSVDAKDVQVKFDYRRTAPNAEPSTTGPWLNIDPVWDIPHSPYSQADITLKGEPKEDELDFALLKLKHPAGHEPPAGEDGKRGWVDLSAEPQIPEKQAPIMIVQHPERDHKPPPQMPLQIAFATPGFESLNSKETRIAYTPSTRPGSSGSPVYDGTLQVVALHHNRGQIHPEAKDLVKNNRGIPLNKIRAALDDDVRAQLIAPPEDS